VSDRAALERLVGKRAEETAGLLRVLRGREQMTVRLFSSRATGGRPASNPGEERAAGPGARYLRACARREAALQRELAHVRAEVGQMVLDERVARHATGDLIASVYHLVARGSGVRYAATLADGVAARAIVSGPSPCYAFAEELRL